MEGITACQEMITGLKDLGICILQVLKDGKVDLADFGPLMGLIAKQSELTAAIKDAPSVPAEVKDLTDDEIKSLVQSLLDAVHAVKAA